MKALNKTDVFWIGRLVDDYPLMRWFVKRFSKQFNKFYYGVNHTMEEYNVRNYCMPECYAFPDLIKEDLKDYNFELFDVNTRWSYREWRDQTFNEFLSRSTSEYIFHLDTDCWIDPNYIDLLSTMDEFNFNVLCSFKSNRLWPFLLTSRKLIDRTSRDFTTSTCRAAVIAPFDDSDGLKSAIKVIWDGDGDHGDKMMKELLEVTDYKGWRFYEKEGVEFIHYAGRTTFHNCLRSVMTNKAYMFGEKPVHEILLSQKDVHSAYLNKIKDTGVTLFDPYVKEMDFFFQNRDTLPVFLP